jgi:DNA recombination protein RmuC
MPFFWILIGGVLGGALTLAVVRGHALARIAALEAERDAERKSADEKLELVQRQEQSFEERFRAFSAEALQTSQTRFFELADAKLAPLKDTLEKVTTQTRELESSRKGAYESVLQQVQQIKEGHRELRSETSKLRTALRTPHVRGRWGELQLKRVVELAGMLAHCDFVEQTSVRDADGSLLRPDVVIKLPGGKNVVVDAKAPLHAYLDALESEDENERVPHLQAHARTVRDHIVKLGQKRYWQQFSPAPEFVVMFLPDESYFRAALEQDPALIHAGVEAGVIPASPTTLIALLRTVAYGWQQETVAESARAVGALGAELYERLGVFARHLSKAGRSLDGAVTAYNDAVGSLESRVLVTARKLEQHGVGDGLPEVAPLDRQTRPLLAAELTGETVRELPSADAA